MSVVTVIVPGAPVGKGRPKFTTRGGFGRAYTPKKTRDYETDVGERGKAAMRRADLLDPLAGPLGMSLVAFVPVPKSWPLKRRKSALEGSELPTPKPDLDNVAKAVLDGLQGIVFVDDCQVCEMTLAKRYADVPRVEIQLYTI